MNYVAESGVRPEQRYYDYISSAAEKKARRSTDYGVQASRLNDAGLNSSGYEDYLNLKSREAYEQDVDYATRGLKYDEYKNDKGYEKYLSDYDALQQKTSEALIKKIGAGSNFSIEDAYDAAVRAGIDESLAYFTASSAVNLAKENAMQTALTFAKLNGLTAKQAKEYAKSLGLDERWAEKVYKSISSFTETEKQYFTHMDAESYYDYIISQSKKNK